MAHSAKSSAATTLAVLEELSLNSGLGVSQLARRMKLAKSSVQRMLLVLKETGWARQDAGAKWSLTLKCAVVSQRVMTRTTLSEVVRPLILELRDATQETARCYLIEGTNIVLLDVAESGHVVRAVEEELPNSLPLHATAIGKATLAAKPDELALLLDQTLEAVTPKTITDAQVLRTEIEYARTTGWTQVLEEMHLDVGGVAAVADLGPDVMIGMTVTFPLHRAAAGEAETYGRLVKDFACRASQLARSRMF